MLEVLGILIEKRAHLHAHLPKISKLSVDILFHHYLRLVGLTEDISI
jgi:hypothetical protein